MLFRISRIQYEPYDDYNDKVNNYKVDNTTLILLELVFK